jgi:1-acyl-sn-glycerol-3-phosphate acyltransferase
MIERVLVAPILILLLLLGAVGGCLRYLIGWTDYTLGQSILYLANSLVTRVLWRSKVFGSIDLPPGQGAVVVCNHRSGIDPFFIQASTKRVMHWMVASEYYGYPVLNAVFQVLQTIPVSRRGVDTAATKQAIRYAQQGGLVGLFLEGRINTTEKLLLPGRPGAAMIALKARVPVIPCYIHNAPYDGTAVGPMFMTAKSDLIIGEPIDLSAYFDRDSDKEVQADLTKRFLREIARLAGDSNFEPELAGRRWAHDEEQAELAEEVEQ